MELFNILSGSITHRNIEKSPTYHSLCNASAKYKQRAKVHVS